VRQLFNSRTGPAAAGLIVVASSVYTLLTTSQDSLNFRLHVALLAFIAIVGMIGTARRRGS
jgi:hypothetical protein